MENKSTYSPVSRKEKIILWLYSKLETSNHRTSFKYAPIYQSLNSSQHFHLNPQLRKSAGQ